VNTTGILKLNLNITKFKLKILYAEKQWIDTDINLNIKEYK